MQDHPRMPPSEQGLNPKSRKKKSSTNKSALLPIERNDFKESVPSKTGKKTSKRNSKKEMSPVFQQPERSNSDSLPESSTSGNEYRALRRKYLLLEEESFAMGVCITAGINPRSCIQQLGMNMGFHVSTPVLSVSARDVDRFQNFLDGQLEWHRSDIYS
ncbi:hypothetical protein GOBAR_DD34455 [Gossypium barbadense]|nr:hypothetical protein GOBAR_DD34455 [Gossypium barbadense]